MKKLVVFAAFGLLATAQAMTTTIQNNTVDPITVAASYRGKTDGTGGTLNKNKWSFNVSDIAAGASQNIGIRGTASYNNELISIELFSRGYPIGKLDASYVFGMNPEGKNAKAGTITITTSASSAWDYNIEWNIKP